jgi:hypothetical protein
MYTYLVRLARHLRATLDLDRFRLQVTQFANSGDLRKPLWSIFHFVHCLRRSDPLNAMQPGLSPWVLPRRPSLRT